MDEFERDKIVADLTVQSNIDTVLARHVLSGTDWDLIAALKTLSSLEGYENKQNLIEYGPPSKPGHSTSHSVDSGVHSVCDSYSSSMDARHSSTDTASLASSNQDRRLRRDISKDDSSSQGSSQDTNGSKRLTRGFSKTTDNEELVHNARRHVAKGLTQEKRHVPSYCHVETPSYTFTLPDFQHFSLEFRKFLERDLIESSTMKALETSGHLNWWVLNGYAQKLWPLATSGDGNCLLHAASLGMWGFHDRLLMLRKALYLILTKGSRRHALWRRWRWQQTFLNKQAGLIYSEREWRYEWESLLRLSSPQPRSKPNSAEPLQPDEALPNSIDEDDATYESLEDIHVFALAHVLKRAVVVVADTVLRDSGGDALAPIPFGGIYLPFECTPSECHRSPLVLSYDAAHFSALVRMQSGYKTKDATQISGPAAVIPITTKQRKLLPLHFASDPGPDFTWWNDEADHRIARMATLDEQRKLELICKYMDVIRLPERRGSTLRPRDLELYGAPRSASHEGTIDSAVKMKGIETGSMGKLSNKKEKNSIQRIAHSLRMKFAKDKESKHARSNRAKSQDARNRYPSTQKPTPVSLSEIHDPNLIIGARLHQQNLHHFMEEMIENYLRSARGRFDAQQKNKANCVDGRANNNNARSRISRSLSTSSLVVSCMNGECDRPASHSTNFLCQPCFSTQKEMMASFRVPQGPIPNPSNDKGPIPNPSNDMQVLRETSFEDASFHYPDVTTQVSQPSSTTMSSLVVRRLGESPQQTPKKGEEDRYGVSAVTNQMGVTRYYFTPPVEVDNCRNSHCSNYSNGYHQLCSLCVIKLSDNKRN